MSINYPSSIFLVYTVISMPWYTLRDQLVVAREIIDLYRSRRTSDIAESLSAICFSLARVFEYSSSQNAIWDELFSYFDQEYMALTGSSRHPDPNKLELIYRRLCREIEIEQRAIDEKV